MVAFAPEVVTTYHCSVAELAGRALLPLNWSDAGSGLLATLSTYAFVVKSLSPTGVAPRWTANALFAAFFVSSAVPLALTPGPPAPQSGRTSRWCRATWKTDLRALVSS